MATDLVSVEEQPKVVGLMYVMLLLGMIGSALIFGWLLEPYTPGRLIQVVQGAAVITVALNLLARVVPEEGLDQAVEEEVVPYLSCAPGAVARAKALLRTLGPRIDEAVIAHSVAELAACWEGTEAPEGIGAFFEKRKPHWTE